MFVEKMRGLVISKGMENAGKTENFSANT